MEMNIPENEWFALLSDSSLVWIGNCGDFEAADEIAEDLDLDVVWLFNDIEANQWLQCLLDHTDKVIER